MVQPSQQHAAPRVKVAEWGLGTRGLGMLASFWAGIPVEVTQEAGVVTRLWTLAIGTESHTTRKDKVGVLYPNPQRERVVVESGNWDTTSFSNYSLKSTRFGQQFNSAESLYVI